MCAGGGGTTHVSLLFNFKGCSVPPDQAADSIAWLPRPRHALQAEAERLGAVLAEKAAQQQQLEVDLQVRGGRLAGGC